MKFLRWLYLTITRWAHPFERRTEKFLRWVNGFRTREEVVRRLTQLMQEDFLVLSVWLEKRFKNYRSLTRRARLKLYRNAQRLMHDFDEFRARYNASGTGLLEKLKEHAPKLMATDAPQLSLIATIMAYMKPGNRYLYEESVSFSRLLVDPSKEQMVGDCNQIVTLYAILFAREFPITELSIKLLPGHVCLHYRGVDIEATTATFAHYKDYEFIAPITELVSTNLLDVSEPGESVSAVEPEVFVKGAQLAHAISSRRETVEHNMKVAYKNLALAALTIHEFDRAQYYAKRLAEADFTKHCAAVEFSYRAKRLNEVATSIQSARTHKSDYKKLLALARVMGESERVRELEGILKQM